MPWRTASSFTPLFSSASARIPALTAEHIISKYLPRPIMSVYRMTVR